MALRAVDSFVRAIQRKPGCIVVNLDIDELLDAVAGVARAIIKLIAVHIVGLVTAHAIPRDRRIKLHKPSRAALFMA